MGDLNATIPIIILYVNEINIYIKWQKLLVWIKKNQDPTSCCS